MHCIECGTQIPDNSKFCSHCGKSQNDAESSIKEHKQSLDYKFLKKAMIWYLLWIMPHLFFLLALSDGLFDKKNMDGSRDFWPFGNSAEFAEIGQYDITEFLFYTISPLIVLVIISMIRSNQKNK